MYIYTGFHMPPLFRSFRIRMCFYMWNGECSFTYLMYHFSLNSFSLTKEWIKDIKVNTDCHILTECQVGNWLDDLDLCNDMTTKKKTCNVKWYHATVTGIKAHSEPCSSSRARKSAMTAKYTVELARVCHFLPTLPKHISHVIKREHWRSHASYFSRPLPCVVVFYLNFTWFYL